MKVFHGVYAFNSAIQDFELLGVFSKPEEAAAAKADETARLRAEQQPHLSDVYVIPQSLDMLVAQLLKARLGKLHDVLIRLEAKA